MRMRSKWGARLAIVGSAALAAPLAAAPGVRMSWQTFAQDPARVQSLRNGVAAMKARDGADPKSALFRTSWQYWANIHGYYGSTSVFGTIEGAVARYKASGGDPSLLPDFDCIANATPPDAVAQQVWGRCQHGTDWFFAWHRLYLYYFEQVLQKAANDPTLRLPYWDYTNPAELAMPAAYTTPAYVDAQGEAALNPLYEKRRYPGWNVPTTNTLDASATDIDDTLADTSFFDVSGQGDGFQNGIEFNVHGYVHCTVIDCPVPDMGAVGYSSNDPVFWAHHANIDRMLDCWTSLGNRTPDDAAYLAKTFSFVDADGNLVTNAVADLTNGKIQLGYVYEQASDCARPAPPLPTAAPPPAVLGQQALQEARAKLAHPVVLGRAQRQTLLAPSTRIRLPLTVEPAGSPLRMLTFRGHPALPVKTHLVLRDITFDAHPGTQFAVVLARRDDPTRQLRVGTLNFFIGPDGAHLGHGGAANARDFDVTRELRQLAGDAADLDALDVVVEATSGRVGGTGAHFDPKARVTIGALELRVVGVPR